MHLMLFPLVVRDSVLLSCFLKMTYLATWALCDIHHHISVYTLSDLDSFLT